MTHLNFDLPRKAAQVRRLAIDERRLAMAARQGLVRVSGIVIGQSCRDRRWPANGRMGEWAIERRVKA
jgi:hypothetical protein